jgi:hypothetical protein
MAGHSTDPFVQICASQRSSGVQGANPFLQSNLFYEVYPGRYDIAARRGRITGQNCSDAGYGRIRDVSTDVSCSELLSRELVGHL